MEATQMAKGRSPNYPSMSLADAVKRLRPVYEGVHTYPTPRDVIFENLGYSGASGRALTVLGTLRRYGLLIPEGKGHLKVSDRAVSILELPEGATERNEAIRAAAFEPELFSEMDKDFPEKLPNDSSLKHYLIKKGFMPKAAEEIIHVYRANLELVEEQGGEYNQAMPPQTTPLGTPSHLSRPEIAQILTGSKGVPKGDKELIFNISRETEAQVSFRGPVTQEAIEKLAALLDLQKDTFPTNAELQPKPETDKQD